MINFKRTRLARAISLTLTGSAVAAMADLPDLHEPPALGPISTGLGQIFLYYLEMEDDADTGGLDCSHP